MTRNASRITKTTQDKSEALPVLPVLPVLDLEAIEEEGEEGEDEDEGDEDEEVGEVETLEEGRSGEAEVVRNNHGLHENQIGVQLQEYVGILPEEYGYTLNFPPNTAREHVHTEADLRIIQANSQGIHNIEAVIKPVKAVDAIEREARVSEITAQVPKLLGGNNMEAKMQAGRKRADEKRAQAKNESNQ